MTMKGRRSTDPAYRPYQYEPRRHHFIEPKPDYRALRWFLLGYLIVLAVTVYLVFSA